MAPSRRHRGGGWAGASSLPLLEIAFVWLLFAVVAVEILVTYSRLPAVQLYHVSESGLEGGLSRALVFLNFPAALAAIPILLLLADRLRGAALVLALVGVAASAAVFWPGVVDEADLDARPVNVIAAAGVGIAFALTIVTARRTGALSVRAGPRRGDRLRILLALAGVAAAVPWIAADLGLSFNGVPILGTVYQTGEIRHQPGVPGAHPAVHHGHHHGMDGLLLVLTALLLSRLLPALAGPRLRAVAAAFLALMLAYGFGEIANDFWTEQVVKRGWTTWAVPNVTEPRATIAWGVILAVAALVYAAWFGRTRTPSPRIAVPLAPRG